MKLLFVVNPISGDVDKKPFMDSAKELCTKYGLEYEIFETIKDDGSKVLKQAIIEINPNRVIAVGGDGTVLFTSIALMGSNIPMGIIPLGSANGLALELYVNSNPIEALKDAIVSDVIAGLDMVLVNDKHYSIHIGDVGLNAAIVEAYENDENRGMAVYAKYFWEELKNQKKFKYSIKANGKNIRGEGLMVAICNSRKYGSGIPLNITGNPMDGKFEIVVVENIGANTLLKTGLSKFSNLFYDDNNMKVISCKEADLTFDKPHMLQLDGELIGKFDSLNVKIIPSAVRFITHKDNEYL
ncbi:MAG: lipid kinase [Ichthyobacteriaceae bacterium]|nr:lipid kinase [Ichthyobacteriaceae bacterium]